MTFRRLLLFTAVLLAFRAVAATAQDSDASNSFERKYIDAAAYRTDRWQVYDWPALTELVVWARRLESAVAQSDETLTGELIAEFATRVDRLRAEPLPSFLAGRADSVAAALAGIEIALERAEAAVGTMPAAQIESQPGKASTDAERQRTLVTGSTAVTVPAGVAVGSGRDSLPAVAFESGEIVNFVDLVALALLELDRVVHFTRSAESKAEVTARPPVREPTPAPDKPPPRSEP